MSIGRYGKFFALNHDKSLHIAHLLLLCTVCKVPSKKTRKDFLKDVGSTVGFLTLRLVDNTYMKNNRKNRMPILRIRGPRNAHIKYEKATAIENHRFNLAS